MQEYAKTFYKSQAWKHLREAYAKQKGWLCEKCLARGLYAPGEIVHHKIFLTPDNIGDPSVSLNPEYLELVCRECHAEEHKGVEKRWTVDELGRVSPR